MPVPGAAILESFNPLDRGYIIPPSQRVIGAGGETTIYKRSNHKFPPQYVFIQNLGTGTVDIVFNETADGNQRHIQLTASTGVLPAISLPIGSWFVQQISLWSTAGSTISYLLVLTGNNGRVIN